MKSWSLLLTVLAVGALAETPQPIAIQPHDAGGVDVALLEVKRTSGDTVTVTWEYRNKTSELKRLTDERTGWMDPYRLTVDAYLADSAGRVKYPVIRDSERHPIAARSGAPNQYIAVKPKQTLATWAKFQAPPAGVEKIGVYIKGVAPFEDVRIEPETK